MQKFASLHELYLSTLEEVYRDFAYRHSPRGTAERELVGYSACLANPIARHCLHPARKQNIIFNYAEALWYLSGRNDTGFIAYYAPSISRYSADGVSLPGTGYGRRLLCFGPQGLNQIDRALDILCNDDPDSKRVVLQIFNAEEDLYRRNIDVSCTLGLQLLRRQDGLHMVAYLRANDAYVGLLGDIFAFTFLQEYFASVIGCELGTYSHHVGSIHVYDSNSNAVEALLRQVNEVPFPQPSPPRMPPGCSPSHIHHMLLLEARIRSGALDYAGIEDIDVHGYWREILLLFRLQKALHLKERIPLEALTGLHPLHLTLVKNRWGQELSALCTGWH
ncbi:MAG: thymidylate synthase [Pyrinomonadaceae bacterium]|nr:thymidylate synthase [Phycisphaerales bacterium]